MYVIKCRVSGGVTGTRESYLKENGEVQTFTDKTEAELVAAGLQMSMNRGPGLAVFHYEAVSAHV